MKTAHIALIGSAAVSLAAGGMIALAMPQQGQPFSGQSSGQFSQGTPAAQPRPANSQPRPNGGNGNLPPATQPQQTQPSNQQGQPNNQPGNQTNGLENRYQRPFAFQSPAYESRFMESSQRLVAMEQRLARSNQDLMKRLGDARALTGERQSAALFDVVQQMLKDQSAMNQYLVRARTAWSGDIEGSSTNLDDEYWNGVNGNQAPGAPNGTPMQTTPNNSTSQPGSQQTQPQTQPRNP